MCDKGCKGTCQGDCQGGEPRSVWGEYPGIEPFRGRVICGYCGDTKYVTYPFVITEASCPGCGVLCRVRAAYEFNEHVA